MLWKSGMEKKKLRAFHLVPLQWLYNAHFLVWQLSNIWAVLWHAAIVRAHLDSTQKGKLEWIDSTITQSSCDGQRRQQQQQQQQRHVSHAILFSFSHSLQMLCSIANSAFSFSLTISVNSRYICPIMTSKEIDHYLSLKTVWRDYAQEVLVIAFTAQITARCWVTNLRDIKKL